MLWKVCKEKQEDIVQMRRSLHEIPELGDCLPQTKSYLINQLCNMGIPYIENETDDGLCAVIVGEKPGKTLAFRADMDALPIQETNPVEFCSQHEGCMHACGHDAHMAMLLGAAKVLQENKEQLNGTVKFLFQTDEETSKGAKRCIQEGHLQGVDAIFGMHIGTILSKTIPSGTVVSVPGCCMASFDKFVIKVRGKGCHGSTPENGIDPINISSHIVINLQEVLAREIAAVSPAVLNVCRLESGFAYNVAPEEASIEGTFRAVDESIRQTIAARIEDIAKGTAAMFRGEAECEIIWGAPPVVNDKAMARFAAECAGEFLEEERIMQEIQAPSMIGEDFAYYLQEIPGAFLLLSSSNQEKGTDVAHHTSDFQIDEDVLWIGSAMYVTIAEKMLFDFVE